MTVLRKTAAALEARGVEVTESIEPEPHPRGYDIAHVFNTHPPPGILRQVASLKRHGVPIVISPIYHHMPFLSWASMCIKQIFATERSKLEMAQFLEALRQRQLKITLPDGGTVNCVDGMPNSGKYLQTQREILQQADYLLPASYLEIAQMQNVLRVLNKPFCVVPFGMDAQDFLRADPELFAAKYGLRDFVLQVSRFDGSKNQLMLLRALRDTQLQVVLIGNLLSPDYVEMCRRQATDRVTIIPYLPIEELRSAYAAARVHVLPSFMETCGLVTMEAALADCNVVTSCTGNEVEYFRELAYYCDPVDLTSIRDAVVAAYDNYPRDAARRQRLRDLIVQNYSWPSAAAAIHAVYKGLVG